MTAAVQVEVGFGSTWQTEPADITWTDVSSYVLLDSGIVMQRGASSARGQVDVGTMRLSLLNSDRRFDPTYTAGPYYGDLKPGVPIRVKTGFADDLSWGDDLLMWDTDYMIWVGATTMLWRGTVSGWPQRYDVGNTMSWVPLSCYDGFDKLARAKIPRSVMESAIMPLGPVGYWPLNDPAGSLTASDSVGVNFGEAWDEPTFGASELSPGLGSSVEFDGVNDRIDISRSPLVDPDGVAVVAVIQTSVPADAASVHPIFMQADGNNSAQTAVQVYVETDGTVCIVANLPPSGAGTFTELHNTTDVSDGLPHLVIAQSAAPTASVLSGVCIDSATLDTSTFSAAFQEGQGAAIGGTPGASVGYDDNYFDGFLSHVALFAYELSSPQRQTIVDAYAALSGQTTDERIDWILDELGWPTNLRSLRTGVAELGPATFKPGDIALPYLRQIEQTEDGRLFLNPDGEIRFVERYWRYLAGNATTVQFTFTDTPGGTGYAEFDLDVDDDLLVNVARFTRRDGTEQVATNTASVTLYGEAELQRNDLLLTTDAEVLSLAEWTVATQSTPLPRCPKIRVPISRYLGPDATDVLTLDLGHRVQVSRTPQGVGSAITIDLVVDGIRIEIGNAGIWWEAFVSPVPEDTVPLAIYDTSVYDGTDVYAP